ncbi:MAG: protein translocase subunit SecD [Planctomycetota bacterium]
MNAKHLPLKFALLAIAVLICVWSLSSKGLEQGIDLRGGHSLVFEIRTNQMELQRLRARREAMLTQIHRAEQAGDAERAEDLRRAVQRMEEDIADLEQAPPSSGDLASQMIGVLKRRIDPQGLLGVEFRPLGSNRIEIRIRAAGEDTLQAKSSYYAAVEKLEAGNLTQVKLRRLLRTYGEDERTAALDERIAALAHDDADQVARIEQVLETYDAMERARDSLKDAEKHLEVAKKAYALLSGLARAQQRLAAARDARTKADEALTAAREALSELQADDGEGDAAEDAAERIAEAEGEAEVRRQLAALHEAEQAVTQAEADLRTAEQAVTAAVAFVVAHDRLDAADEGDEAEARERYDAAVAAIKALRAADAAERRLEAAETDAARATAGEALDAARERVASRVEAVADLAEGAEPLELVDRANEIAAARDEAVDASLAALKQAESQHAAARQAAVEYGSVREAELERNVLSFYVPPHEAEASKRAEHVRAVEAKRKIFRTRVEDLLAAHPARREQIESAIEAYKKWADLRRPLDDPEDLKRIVAKAGVLEFRIAPGLPGTQGYAVDRETFRRYHRLLQEEGPEEVRKRDGEFIWLPIEGAPGERFGGVVVVHNEGERYRHADGKHYILCSNTDAFTMLHEEPPGGWTLTGAGVTHDQMGRPAVSFEFDSRGAKLFSRLTSAHKGKQMAVMVDDVVYSAPRIKATISREGIIEGSFTRAEAEDLARTLRAGSLPARLNPNPVSENTFGPSIGEVNRQRGFRAAIWGLMLVAAFMLIYYMLAGFLANVALLLNIILVLGAMSLMSAVFTLPGIAGVILTIGIAVDANVLIFERLREEQAKGQSVRMTLTNAYQRAFSAIFDANVTTLITCLILGWVGSEEVRGFAITLGLGVVFSLFTAMVVTRWLFQFLLDRGLLKRPVTMLSILGTPRVNWMRNRHLFWGVSVALLVVGIGSLLWQKGDILGIEFSSGTQSIVQFKEGALLKDPDSGEQVLPNDALVRRLYVREARQAGHDKLAATARVEKRIDPDRVESFMGRWDANDDGKLTDDETPGTPRFFELLDADGNAAVTAAELDDRLPAREYQISTTVTDVQIVRGTGAAAFADALQTRRARTYAPRTGRLARLGVQVKREGGVVIDETTLAAADPAFRPELEAFRGGALFAFESIVPAITPRDMDERIGDMRRQIDFSDHRFARTKIVPLDAPTDGPQTSLAVLVKPAEPVPADRMTEWTAKEQDLLAAAFKRSQAGEMRNFDAAIAGEMAQRAILAVVLSWLAIVGYLWFRFGSARWGLAAVACLIHDVVIVVGMVAVSGWLYKTWLGDVLALSSFKIDLAMIAAILTVIGYSVNDTIVVFDRIRENRGKLTTVSGEVINRSINQTLSRTLLTSGTTFLVVLVMYAFGGAGIHAFSFALLVGVIFGTYSSIAVASPLLMGLRKALVARAVGEPGTEPTG